MSSSPTPELVFVYGTLRPGQPNHHLVERWSAPHLLNAHADAHTLYLPRHRAFPYLVPTISGLQGVQGDLLRIPATDWPHARRILDDLEGYDPRNPPHANHYTRTQIPITHHHRTLTAWTYLAGPHALDQIHTMTHLPSGIWPPATPARGAILITPDTHTTVHPLIPNGAPVGDAHSTITRLLGGPAEPLELPTGLQLWTRTNPHTPDCTPNPLASIALGAPGPLELLDGPVLVCGHDDRLEPRDLGIEQVAALLERCLLLGGQDEVMGRLVQAGAVQRSWLSVQM